MKSVLRWSGLGAWGLVLFLISAISVSVTLLGIAGFLFFIIGMILWNSSATLTGLAWILFFSAVFLFGGGVILIALTDEWKSFKEEIFG